MKPTAEDIESAIVELEIYRHAHESVLECDHRISRPLHELEAALHTKHANETEPKPS